MRKPKTHPSWGMSLVGINFRERWNVVQFAEKEELEDYIINFKHINRNVYREPGQSWWDLQQKTINERTQNNYFRKLWRKRYSESFQFEKIYSVGRNIERWNMKLGPRTGCGSAQSYRMQNNRSQLLHKGDLVMLTNKDELGNLYFVKLNEVDAPHPYVFSRDGAQLSYITPLES